MQELSTSTESGRQKTDRNVSPILPLPSVPVMVHSSLKWPWALHLLKPQFPIPTGRTLSPHHCWPKLCSTSCVECPCYLLLLPSIRSPQSSWEVVVLFSNVGKNMVKATILNILSVQFIDIKYSHNIVQPSHYPFPELFNIPNRSSVLIKQ